MQSCHFAIGAAFGKQVCYRRLDGRGGGIALMSPPRSAVAARPCVGLAQLSGSRLRHQPVTPSGIPTGFGAAEWRAEQFCIEAVDGCGTTAPAEFFKDRTVARATSFACALMHQAVIAQPCGCQCRIDPLAALLPMGQDGVGINNRCGRCVPFVRCNGCAASQIVAVLTPRRKEATRENNLRIIYTDRQGKRRDALSPGDDGGDSRRAESRSGSTLNARHFEQLTFTSI